MNIRARLQQIYKNRKRQREVLGFVDSGNEEQEENDENVPEVAEDVEIDFGNEEEGESEEVEFEEGVTNMGGVCLWSEGFRYTKISENYWRCHDRKCRAKAKAVQNQNGQYTGTISGEHYHGPGIERKGAEQKRNQIKHRMKADPRAKQRKVLAAVRNDAELEVVAAMGCDAALSQMIWRQNKQLSGNVNTVNPLQMNFPDALLDKDGHSTLFYDSRTNRPGQSDVIFVFTHPKLLDVLRKNRQWALDGTFKAAPRPFTQCFCLGAFVSGRIVVCAQGLLPSKRRVHYEEMLEAIKNAIHPVTPNRSDHTYNRPVLFGQPSPQPSTPTIPSTISLPRWEMPIVRPPQYSIDFWNVHERAVAAIARTNNALESSHLHFVKNLNHHPSMSHFLLEILDDVDKQWDIARTAPLFKQKRHTKYVIKEQEIMVTLTGAVQNGDYDDDGGLLNLVTLLGLQMMGFVNGLNAARNPEEREVEDESDFEDERDLESDFPSTSAHISN